MFNLVMFNVDWLSRKVTVPINRIFEHTDKHIADQFRQDGNPLLDRLTVYPCIFCEEGKDGESAYVGQINRFKIIGRDLSLEISLDNEVPRLQNSILYTNRLELDMPNDFEFSRNHWALKDVDLYRFLLRTVRPRRQHPTVFQISEHEKIDPVLASVMMPFDKAFAPVYDSIKQASKEVSLRCRRADEIWENPAIIQDVVALIDRSRIVICDCTGRNPNVFYEAGIAHTLGREVILITQNEQDIPFDLRHLRHIRYENDGVGLAKLTLALQDKMQSILGH